MMAPMLEVVLGVGSAASLVQSDVADEPRMDQGSWEGLGVETRDCGLSCGGHQTVTVEWAGQSCGGPEQLAGTEDLDRQSCEGPEELAMVTLVLDMGMGWISKIDEMPGVGAGNPEAEETKENLMAKRYCLYCKSNCCSRRTMIFQWVRAAMEFGGL